MMAVSLVAGAFLVGITTAALGLMAWLLSGAPTLIARGVRASARGGSDAAACDSGRPAPRPGATPERPDR